VSRLLVVMLVLGGGCGRMFFDPPVDATRSDDAAPTRAGPTPIHRYRLAGSFADDAGGPALIGLGGVLDAEVGYRFAANQGLKLVGGMPAGAYTVDIRFVFDEIIRRGPPSA
jgi:hypothetical protein